MTETLVLKVLRAGESSAKFAVPTGRDGRNSLFAREKARYFQFTRVNRNRRPLAGRGAGRRGEKNVCEGRVCIERGQPALAFCASAFRLAKPNKYDTGRRSRLRLDEIQIVSRRLHPRDCARATEFLRRWRPMVGCCVRCPDTPGEWKSLVREIRRGHGVAFAMRHVIRALGRSARKNMPTSSTTRATSRRDACCTETNIIPDLQREISRVSVYAIICVFEESARAGESENLRATEQLAVRRSASPTERFY